MTPEILFLSTLWAVCLWTALGEIGLLVGVLWLDLKAPHKTCMWAAIFGPLTLIAVINAIIRGEDV